MKPFRSRMIGGVLLVAASFFVSVHGAVADALGEVRTFFVDTDYDAQSASRISATARGVGQHAYFYVDDRFWVGLSDDQRNRFMIALNGLVSDVDTVIYPQATTFWGSEPKPGVDGDTRMTILLERLVQGNGGYFQSANEYPVSRISDSNAREMIVVGVDSVTTSNARNFTAHELQHLISFNQKELLQGISDDTWLNEARSEYNITVVGYSEPFEGSGLQRRMFSFLRTSSDSLVDWPNTSTDYAIAAIVTHYMADRYGPDIMASTIHASENGVRAIDAWLSQQGKSERFADLFTDWMVASYLNDPSVDPRYAYVRSGLSSMHVAPNQQVMVNAGAPVAVSTALQEWQPWWLGVNVGVSDQPVLTIQLDGQFGPSWSGATIAAYANGQHRVVPFSAVNGHATLGVATRLDGARLMSVVLAATQGIEAAVGGRQLPALPLSVTATLGAMPESVVPQPSAIKDGDLIRRVGQDEIYVLWGTYRRYLPAGVLKLYGFENRPVTPVADDVFNRYTTSNYVRAIDEKKVYALWPDGTKHWLNITPTQWDASGRDWNAIFTVNAAEVSFYATGPDITR